MFLNKDDDDDDDDDVIGSTFVGSTQTFFYRAACVIGVSSLGYLDAPAVLPTSLHLRNLPVSLTESKKTSFSYQLSSCLQFIKIELGSTGGDQKTTYSDSFDIEALGS